MNTHSWPCSSVNTLNSVRSPVTALPLHFHWIESVLMPAHSSRAGFCLFWIKASSGVRMNWGRLVRACTVAEGLERLLIWFENLILCNYYYKRALAARQSGPVYLGLVYFECPSGVSRIIRTIMAVLYLPLRGPFGRFLTTTTIYDKYLR